MNDLDVMRTMRADAPIPSQERLDTGRERLLAAIESSSPRAVPTRRRHGGIRGILLAGGAAAVATAVAVAMQMGVHPTAVDVRPTTLHPLPAADAKYTDLLVERAAFGWLPPGMRPNRFGVDHQVQDAYGVTADEPETRAVVHLNDYGRGKEPDLPALPGGAPGRRIPAPPVNGHDAYWTFAPDENGQSTFELRWQYAPDSWAELTATGLHGSSAELTTTAYKIAESVTFGGTRPVALPLHVDGVPGGLTPTATGLENTAFGEVSADLAFLEAGGSNLMITITKSDGVIGTGVPNAQGVIPGLPRPNTKLDGHLAFQKPGLVHVYGVNGFDVHMSATGAILAKLNETGGVAGLFHRTTILGTDEANWTTKPVN
ncbi:hypothetical protein ACFFHJ_15240 [Planotetraspora thailandica]|uniref:hypothetical protein n=1 Tax=Planotetraspora thailandica TaxID=487172 RepID=UPI00194F8F24|nr:hypothetical protein [Planotetraspora thailandica]